MTTASASFQLDHSRDDHVRRGAAPAPRWIVGPVVDVACFLLPAISGYVIIYLNAVVGISSFLLWWFWNVSVNGPHFFATISRTYLDADEWRRRGGLLLGSLGFVFLGPLAIASSIALRTRTPFIVFWLFQAVWAYYHVIRQHYGFMALYQKRSGEPVGRDNPADFWSFNFLMLVPALIWFVQYPVLRDALGLRARVSAAEGGLVGALAASLLAVAVAFVAKELVRAREGRMNVPKCLLLLAYVPLHAFLFLYPAVAHRYDLLLVNAVVTYPHSVQYMGIVWFHNRNRYAADAEGGGHDLAHYASRTVFRFLGCALVFGLVFFYLDWYLEGRAVPFAPGYFRRAQLPLGQGFTVSDLIAVTWLGFIFNHYYLDQKIWRIRTDTRLNRDLGLAVRGPAVPVAS